MKKLLILILLIPFLLTGCWDELIIEKTGFMLIYGVDLSNDGRYIATFGFPSIGAETKDHIEVISTEYKNAREARENARRSSSQSIVGGKTQEVLFSENVASNGISSHLQIFERDAYNPSLAYVVIVEGSAKELITKISNVNIRKSSPLYIHHLISEHAENSKVFDTRVYQFDVMYYAEGLDPVAPLVKMQDNSVLVLGTALFSEDKMVGKINVDDTILLHALMNNLSDAEYPFTSNNVKSKIGSELVALLKNSKRKITINIEDNIPVINVDLNITARISDFKWNDLSEESMQKNIEAALSSEVEKSCNKLVRYLQQSGSDPIGFGNMIRVKHNKYWRSINWNQIYKEASINVKAHVTYTEYGTIK